MHSLCFTAETSSKGVVERDFIVGEVPGVLWSPVSAADHAPLVLMGHGGGLHKKTPALMSRAHDTVTTWGFSVVAIDAPGHGEPVALRVAAPAPKDHDRRLEYSISSRRCRCGG